jgi:putative transposase
MTKAQGKVEIIDLKADIARDLDFLRAAVKAALDAALEAEMTETLGAQKGERTEARLGYRSGYYQRSLITRVGTLELRVPQDRAGRFSTELFERYQAVLIAVAVDGEGRRQVLAVELANRESRSSWRDFC